MPRPSRGWVRRGCWRRIWRGRRGRVWRRRRGGFRSRRRRLLGRRCRGGFGRRGRTGRWSRCRSRRRRRGRREPRGRPRRRARGELRSRLAMGSRRAWDDRRRGLGARDCSLGLAGSVACWLGGRCIDLAGWSGRHDRSIDAKHALLRFAGGAVRPEHDRDQADHRKGEKRDARIAHESLTGRARAWGAGRRPHPDRALCRGHACGSRRRAGHDRNAWLRRIGRARRHSSRCSDGSDPIRDLIGAQDDRRSLLIGLPRPAARQAPQDVHADRTVDDVERAADRVRRSVST